MGKHVERLSGLLEQAEKLGIKDLKTQPVKSLADYSSKKKDYTRGLIRSEIASILHQLKKVKGAGEIHQKLRVTHSIDGIRRLIPTLKRIPFPEDTQMNTKLRLPAEIREDIEMDIEELERCFSSDCLRSAVILCGRILETALHRKYYDKTGVDLLEKSPGIGLGKIIAKLREKDVELDPGITQQVHLINQIRVHSVHKKSDNFVPTKNQAQAIMLYTMDILERLYS